MAATPRNRRARTAPKVTREQCDVRLEPAAGETCDVKATAVVRHLSKAPTYREAWCGIEFGTADGVCNELTHAPRETSCKKCLDERLEAVKRANRLWGNFADLGEVDEYDNPYERLTAEQLDRLSDEDRGQVLQEFASTLTRGEAEAYFAAPPAEPTATLPGSEGKIEVMASRHSKREELSRDGDTHLEIISAALLVQNARNGATAVLGVIEIRGEEAEEDHDEWLEETTAEDLQDRSPGLFALVSGESFLQRLEARIGRPLNDAARTLAAWPWHWRTA